MVDLQPVRDPQKAQETTCTTSYGSFYARMYPTWYGYLAFAVYYVGSDIEITHHSPALSEVEAAAWIQTAFKDGPQFIIPLLEAQHGTA